MFTVCADAWLTTGKGRWKQSTLEGNTSLVTTHLLPRFGALRIAQIDRAAVRALAMALLDAGKTAKTIHNVVRTLSGIFTQAIEDGIVTGNPAGRRGCW